MSITDVLAGRAAWAVETGDALTVLRTLPDGCVQVCATSPPYWKLRSYLSADDPSKPLELGGDPTPQEYVARLVAIFREVKRVLRSDATLWLNLGDSYATNPGNGRGGEAVAGGHRGMTGAPPHRTAADKTGAGLKQKDLIGIPWRVAFALQDDGWYLRSAITWCKTAAMPESVTDRPTSATEMIFLFSKAARYHYDAAAVAEPALRAGDVGEFGGAKGRALVIPPGDPNYRNGSQTWGRTHETGPTRNLRNFWLLGPEPLADDHYAAWPTEIPRRAILAGSRPGDVVLDPFSGSGRTGIVALRHGRRYVGIELSAYQAEKSRARIVADCPMWNQPTEGVPG